MPAYRTVKRWRDLDTSWMRRGSCASMSSEARMIFFQDEKTSVAAKRDTEEATQICRSCPVRQQCLDFALKAEMHYVWGGTTGKQRDKMLGKARIRKRGRDLA